MFDFQSHFLSFIKALVVSKIPSYFFQIQGNIQDFAEKSETLFKECPWQPYAKQNCF